MRTVKTVIRLGGCPGWSKSLLGAQIILLVFSQCGSNYIGLSITVNTLKIEHQKTAVFISRVEQLGDNCIQKIYLGRYIVRYMVRNFILRQHNFRLYNQRYTSPSKNFEYGYPHTNALFNIYSSKAQYFAPNVSFISNVKQLCQPITSDVTYDVCALTIYRRIYWRKFLTLSNQDVVLYLSHVMRKLVLAICEQQRCR